MDLPETNSVEKAFRPAFEEIARRSSAAQAYEEQDVTHFARTTDLVTTPFAIPKQRFVLLSMGTAVLAPRPEDCSRPALRVYGAFPSREDAKEHAEVVRELDATCSLVIVTASEWILMPQNEETRDDVETNKRTLKRKLRAFRDAQSESNVAFDRCVSEHTYQACSVQDEHEDTSEQEEAERLVYKPPKRIRSGAEVRCQSVVALCVVPDAFGECLFKILGCFENGAEADKWIQNVGSRHVTEDDIHVAETCEWIFPNARFKEGSNHYRINELQRIMDAAAKNPQLVQSYKDWKKQQDAGRDAFSALEHATDTPESTVHGDSNAHTTQTVGEDGL